MAEVSFLVKGSSAVEPYEVTFVKKGAELSAFCTCNAGQYGDICKHRIGIIDGDLKLIVSGNVAEAEKVIEWLVGSSLQSALARVREAELEAETAKRELAMAKKALATLMHL